MNNDQTVAMRFIFSPLGAPACQRVISGNDLQLSKWTRATCIDSADGSESKQEAAFGDCTMRLANGTYHSRMPLASATTTASVRFLAPSFSIAFSRWNLTARPLIPRSVAISVFVIPPIAP